MNISLKTSESSMKDGELMRHGRFMMQASKKIPFDDPMVLNGVRGMYVLSNLVIMGLYFYVLRQIEAKKGMWAWSTHIFVMIRLL